MAIQDRALRSLTGYCERPRKEAKRSCHLRALPCGGVALRRSVAAATLPRFAPSSSFLVLSNVLCGAVKPRSMVEVSKIPQCENRLRACDLHRALNRGHSGSIGLLWFGSTSVFRASISSAAGRKQHRLQREQNLLLFAIPGKKLQSVYISPSISHDCADAQRPPVERRRVLNLHFAVDCQLGPCEDGPAIVAYVP
jgi:hypothetical protein